MKQEWKEKWVKALRSGEYEQGREWLKRNGKFCCLGVLCDISKLSEWYEDTYIGLSGALPREVSKLVGGVGEQNKLVDMNDREKKSFLEIADYIEKNL